MKKIIVVLLLIPLIMLADQITGYCDNYSFLDFVVLSPEVCGENVFTILTFSGSFTLEPPTDCSFCNPESLIDYYVTVTHDDGDTVNEPGEPLALYGPFNVDGSCNHSCVEDLHKITEGGFEGEIYNATKMISIDSIMINIYHHYIGSGVDTYMLETTLAPMNLTDLGGGIWHYQMTGISSGGKLVEFFSDANANGTLDPGELATPIDRDVPITGNQYDDSVDVDLTTLVVKNSDVPKPGVFIKVGPNPFNSSLRIFVNNFTEGDRIIIRDISGKTIANYPADDVIIFDGTDTQHNKIPSGMYFVNIQNKPATMVKVWYIR